MKKDVDDERTSKTEELFLVSWFIDAGHSWFHYLVSRSFFKRGQLPALVFNFLLVFFYQ